MEKEASQLIDEILEFLWMENPVEATLAGIHRYDDRLEKLDLVSRRNKLRRKKEFLELIKLCEKISSKNTELKLLRCALELGILMEESVHSLDRDASTYPRIAIYGVYQLVARSSAPYHYRALRAIDRMREVPRVLDEGKLNLSYGDDIPRLWTRAAVDLTVSAREYLARLIESLTKEVPELENVIKKYYETARAAFDEYLEFLIKDLMPRSSGAFSAGEKVFNYLLKHEHLLDIDIDSLRRLAREEIERTGEELVRLSEKMGGGLTWQERLRKPDEDKPQGDLLAHWGEIISKVKKAIRSANLLTLPSRDNLVLMETPPFERPAIPVAGYIEAPPFEEESKAFFCVTPLPEDMGKEDRETILDSHSGSRALFTVTRELYPGRHTLLARRIKKRNRLAYLSRRNIFEEGWSSYVPGLLVEQGLFDNRNFEFLVLHARLLDAWRVLVDIDLHCTGKNESQAVADLVNGAGIPERQAWFQVCHLASSPASSLGALIGRLKIIELRHSFSQAGEDNFSLKKFHDALLRLSAMPLEWLERRLGQAIKQRRI